MLCIDCNTETGSPRRTRCAPCRIIHKYQRVEVNNAKQRDIKRVKAPELCQEHGCTELREVNKGRCAQHLEYRRQKAQAYRDSMAVKTELEPEECIIPIEPWHPRPKPPPLMTDEEQRRIDRETQAKLSARCGIGNGPVRRYTAQEIAEIAGQITPIHNIPRKSGVGYYDNFFKGA